MANNEDPIEWDIASFSLGEVMRDRGYPQFHNPFVPFSHKWKSWRAGWSNKDQAIMSSEFREDSAGSTGDTDHGS